MTVTNRRRLHQPEEISTVSEPGLQIECDSCACDLTHSIRMKCADPVCEVGDGVDICPTCFCAGKEFGKHKRGHEYRVIELRSYPIFTEDWGADEELLLLEGVSQQGLGNWKKIAEHVGTRTKAEVEQHYNSVYVDSPHWPLPRTDIEFNIDPAEFQERKRRRIANMNTTAPPAPKVAPTSAPGVHEVATFLPGRLEFEHELDNDAEDLVKDLEFGVCLEYGGDQIIEDENDLEVLARARWEEERRTGIPRKSVVSNKGAGVGKGPINGISNGKVNGHHTKTIDGDALQPEAQAKAEDDENGNGAEVEEVVQPPPIETEESLKFKLTLIEMYSHRVEKRLENKAIMFDRGLLEYKKMQAAEKKRPKEEKEIVQRLRPFARLQTAEDYEVFTADILYEAILRKRIQELQLYRRLGLTTPADIEKYEVDLIKRTQAKAAPARDYYTSERLQHRASGRQSSADPRYASAGGDSEGRRSHERDLTPKLPGAAPHAPGPGLPGRKPPAPLNLANSPSLHLLTPAEQTLCSQLRILPKPYLVIKETLVREYARRGGKLRRREARDLVKIDVNKTSRVWDFLVQAGFLKIAAEPVQAATHDSATAGPSSAPSINSSPTKDASFRNSSRPPMPSAPSIPVAQNGFGSLAPPPSIPPAAVNHWPPN